jgi:hypothetical protein
MNSITRARIFWTASAASLALAASISGCSSKSSGNPNTGEDGGEESSSSGGSSSGTASSGGSSSGGGSSGGSSSGATSSSGASTDGGTGGSDAGEAGTSSGGGDASCTTLNVYNFKSWCSVGVNGATAATTAEQTVCLAPGSIPLVASAASGTFELGPDPWVYISGTGGTDSGIAGTVSGSMSTTAVVLGSSPGCVLVCCPFTNGTGCTSSESGYTAFLGNCP